MYACSRAALPTAGCKPQYYTYIVNKCTSTQSNTYIMEEGRLMKMTKTRIFPINENLTVMVPVTFHILAAATGITICLLISGESNYH